MLTNVWQELTQTFTTALLQYMQDHVVKFLEISKFKYSVYKFDNSLSTFTGLNFRNAGQEIC